MSYNHLIKILEQNQKFKGFIYKYLRGSKKYEIFFNFRFTLITVFKYLFEIFTFVTIFSIETKQRKFYLS